MEPKLKEYTTSMHKSITHLRAISNTSRINNTEVGAIRDRKTPLDAGEKAIFPVENLPPFRTEQFIGRVSNLHKIHEWLGPDKITKLRTYLIYGRRGIGKTQIALEYARRNAAKYDAIFWIQRETRSSITNSFTETAVKLEIEGAASSHFEENLRRVLSWLRTTRKRWLLIYDNAEREQSLKGFWPAGARGSILLTSRTFHNFFEDDQRHGETVQVFDEKERYELLTSQLGAEWANIHFNRSSMLFQVEKAAVSTLLEETGGLPLAITHAAKIVTNKKVGSRDGSVRGFLELFKRNFEELPPRQKGPRDRLVRALDTIWSIAFRALSQNALTVLSVLALLAPDSILIDLFFPGDPGRLTEKLSFCKTDASTDLIQGRTIQTVVHPSDELANAIAELVAQGMIRQAGRTLSIHREVQEAVHYQSREDLRSSFDAAVHLVFDAFPKQEEGRPLNDDWAACRNWIQHAIQLANQFDRYGEAHVDSPLYSITSSDTLSELLSNCAWYLYETAAYDECLNLLRVARDAARDPTSLVYAHLLNTAGNAYYELNKLGQSRESAEQALDIRRSLLHPNHAELANVLSNLGNVDSAEGRLDEALEKFNQAARIREYIGDAAAVLLALNYLQIGRVYFLQEDHTTAYKFYQKSEGIFMKKAGRNRNLTAHLHFAYGNLELAADEFVTASRSFEYSRRIIMDYNPLHPLCAAAYYKQACAEFEQNHHRKALGLLAKALDIADMRSANVVDGTVARILWKQAEVIMDDPLAEGRDEADRLKIDLELRQREIAESLGVDLRGYDRYEDREKSFDLLVPGYFR